jgi:hypothetical protein
LPHEVSNTVQVPASAGTIVPRTIIAGTPVRRLSMTARLLGVPIATAILCSLGALPAAAQQPIAPGEPHPGSRRPGPPVVQSVSPKSGQPGMTVTVRGRFAPDATVWFGQLEMTPTARTRRSISFEAPRVRPGPHTIRVKSSEGEVVASEFRLEPYDTNNPGPTPLPPPGTQPPGSERPDRARRPRVSDFWPRQGPAGTQITIQGARFSPEFDLVVDGKVVFQKKVRENQITFKAPQGAGEKTISLRRPGGRRDIPVGVFTVVTAGTRTDDRARWRKEWRARAEERWKARQRELARTEAERLEALRVEEERLRRERDRRRREYRDSLRKKWEQAFLADEEVRTELQLHAERSARLSRLLRLAEAGNHGSLVVRIHVMTENENARHERRMTDLKASFGRR